MSLFPAIAISGTGIDAAQTWINTTAGNIANMNDVSSTSTGTYGAQTPVFEPVGIPGQTGDGVAVAGIEEGDTAGVIEYDPSNPLANAQGEVRVPDIELGAQMVGLIAAQTDYQANTSAIADAKTAYQSALTIGS